MLGGQSSGSKQTHGRGNFLLFSGFFTESVSVVLSVHTFGNLSPFTGDEWGQVRLFRFCCQAKKTGDGSAYLELLALAH